MQLIYSIKQEKEEETIDNKLNIILYKIVEPILTIAFAIIVAYLIISSKIGINKLDNEMKILSAEITQLKDATKSDLYFLVEENGKYGYIDKTGNEAIKCEYDKASTFYKNERNDCNVAVVSENNNYYIITKSNDKIKLEGIPKHIVELGEKGKEGKNKLVKYTKEDPNSDFGEMLMKQFGYTEGEGVYKNYLDSFIESKNYDDGVVDLNADSTDTKYTYKNDNYTMEIEETSNPKK